MHTVKRIMRLSALLLIPVLVCCTKEDPQQVDIRRAKITLAGARKAFEAERYDEARDSIYSLRRNSARAFDARRQAILLLDSIELFAARDSLDALPHSARVQYNMVPSGSDIVAIAKGQKPLVVEYERLLMKVKFFERKLLEDQRHAK